MNILDFLEFLLNAMFGTKRNVAYTFGSLILGTLVVLLGVWLDQLLNPWIYDMQWKWWNIFTTYHYCAYSFLNGKAAWILYSLFASLKVWAEFLKHDVLDTY